MYINEDLSSKARMEWYQFSLNFPHTHTEKNYDYLGPNLPYETLTNNKFKGVIKDN